MGTRGGDSLPHARERGLGHQPCDAPLSAAQPAGLGRINVAGLRPQGDPEPTRTSNAETETLLSSSSSSSGLAINNFRSHVLIFISSATMLTS